MRHRNLSDVGVRRFQPRPFAPIDDRDVVAGLAQIPSGGNAGDAGTEDQDFHGRRGCKRSERT
ncbi:MAG: hypothetical protein H6R21_7 [Proteobacteria bacterium]|nr:hypothetical protein [Pseudomonadota bacterium]